MVFCYGKRLFQSQSKHRPKLKILSMVFQRPYPVRAGPRPYLPGRGRIPPLDGSFFQSFPEFLGHMLLIRPSNILSGWASPGRA